MNIFPTVSLVNPVDSPGRHEDENVQVDVTVVAIRIQDTVGQTAAGKAQLSKSTASLMVRLATIQSSS